MCNKHIINKKKCWQQQLPALVTTVLYLHNFYDVIIILLTRVLYMFSEHNSWSRWWVKFNHNQKNKFAPCSYDLTDSNLKKKTRSFSSGLIEISQDTIIYSKCFFLSLRHQGNYSKISLRTGNNQHRPKTHLSFSRASQQFRFHWFFK